MRGNTVYEMKGPMLHSQCFCFAPICVIVYVREHFERVCVSLLTYRLTLCVRRGRAAGCGALHFGALSLL